VFLPFILPAAAVGITFSFLLQRDGGLNRLLSDLGLGFLAQDWLGSTHLAIASIGGVIIWQQLGFGVVVFSAALLAVPGETVEAAQIDGANWWTIQRRIVIPQIRGIIEFFLTLEAIVVLSQVFTYVYVLTAGGPANSSSGLGDYIWGHGFSPAAAGEAAAGAG